MRQLLFIIVLAAAAYYGWDYYQQHSDTIILPWQKTADEARQEESPGAAMPGPRGPALPAEPEFVSKVRIPTAPAGQKPVAPPGSVYVVARSSVETANGIVAVVPGDTVKVLQRKNGKVRVTNDQADFELKEDQVTLDPEVAQAAEKRDFESRMLRR